MKATAYFNNDPSVAPSYFEIELPCDREDALEELRTEIKALYSKWGEFDCSYVRFDFEIEDEATLESIADDYAQEREDRAQERFEREQEIREYDHE